MDLVEQEHYVIMFLYKAGRQINSEIVEEVENNMQHCMIHSQRLLADSCRILAGWKNKYSDRGNRTSDANDDVSFITVSDEIQGNNNKEYITCYKCNKTGHYSNNVMRKKM